MPLVEIKGFNGLINNKPFFDQSVKKQRRSIQNISYEQCESLLKSQEIMIIQQEIY